MMTDDKVSLKTDENNCGETNCQNVIDSSCKTTPMETDGNNAMQTDCKVLVETDSSNHNNIMEITTVENENTLKLDPKSENETEDICSTCGSETVQEALKNYFLDNLHSPPIKYCTVCQDYFDQYFADSDTDDDSDSEDEDADSSDDSDDSEDDSDDSEDDDESDEDDEEENVIQPDVETLGLGDSMKDAEGSNENGQSESEATLEKKLEDGEGNAEITGEMEKSEAESREDIEGSGPGEENIEKKDENGNSEIETVESELETEAEFSGAVEKSLITDDVNTQSRVHAHFLSINMNESEQPSPEQ